MKIPKKTKFRKYRKNNIKRTAQRTSKLRYGSFGLKSLNSARITAQQIETIRQTIRRGIRPKGKV
jgi:large subunit ribosomal protein L16